MKYHYDYYALEKEFIRTRPKLSIRELCRRHGIPDNRVSSIHAKAKQKDGQGRTWYDKQELAEGRATEEIIRVLSRHEAQRALREAEVVDDAIELVAEAINNTRIWMNQQVEITDEVTGEVLAVEPKYRVPIREVNGLIDRLGALLSRQPVSGTSDGGLNFGAADSAQLTTGDGAHPILVGILGVLDRDREPAPRAVGGGSATGSLPDAPDTRSA